MYIKKRWEGDSTYDHKLETFNSLDIQNMFKCINHIVSGKLLTPNRMLCMHLEKRMTTTFVSIKLLKPIKFPLGDKTWEVWHSMPIRKTSTRAREYLTKSWKNKSLNENLEKAIRTHKFVKKKTQTSFERSTTQTWASTKKKQHVSQWLCPICQVQTNNNN